MTRLKTISKLSDLQRAYRRSVENRDGQEYAIFREFQEEISKLTVEEIKYLRALMWFGRGDFPTFEEAEFESSVQLVDEQFPSYFIEKRLDKYLISGLERKHTH